MNADTRSSATATDQPKRPVLLPAARRVLVVARPFDEPK